MKITFYEYKDFLECPKRYDLTARRVKPPEPDNKYFAIYGMTMEKFFQHYCNDWLPKGVTFDRDKVVQALDPLYKSILIRNPVDWNAPFVKMTSREIFDTSVSDILSCLETIPIFKNTRSESTFRITLKNSDRITGRVDFIHKTDDGEVHILDGKGTDVLGKNVSQEQLLMYCLLYYYTNKKMPDKIGFLYYKLRYIDYVPFDLKAVDAFRKKLLLVMQAIKSTKEFVGTPSTKACRYCRYKTVCDEYNQSKIGKQKKSEINLGYDLQFLGLD